MGEVFVKKGEDQEQILVRNEADLKDAAGLQENHQFGENNRQEAIDFTKKPNSV